jgi:FkbM family methyltransferase
MSTPPELVATYLQYPDGSGRTFHHRGVPADNSVIQQMFVQQEYSVRRLRRGAELLAGYKEVVDAGRSPLIVDAGANIGASAVWFAIEYPKAQVVAFEPEEGNFRVLLKNAEGLDIEPHRAAIGSRDGKVNVTDPGNREWGYRTDISDSGVCDMVSMSRVVERKMAAGSVPFIAKIDIEGAERDLFEGPTAWVDRFPLLIIELHDWLLPKQRTAQPFLKCVAQRNRDFVYVGENVFSIRND